MGLDKVAVIGHSCGGFIALELALRYPDRVSHLILLDTAPHIDCSGDRQNARRMGATDEMMTVLQEEWATDEEMRARFQIVLPLYFRNFDPPSPKDLRKGDLHGVRRGARRGVSGL
ncbi:MAG: alpha/beta hydrolase [Anaerolineae bacterium]